MTGTTEVKKPRRKSATLSTAMPTATPTATPTAAPGEMAASGRPDGSSQNEGLDPSVAKLIDYAKIKKEIFFFLLSDYLPEHIANTDKIEQVLTLLAENNIQVIEEDLSEEEEAEPAGRKADTEKKRLNSNEKESSVDDPIRVYLREIGRENLLTAEQEIQLSKQMEDGENIIKRVIKKSGMIIFEFYHIAQRAFSKKDLRELNLTKKEITEHMTERRRLNQFYKETLRLALPDLKNYIDAKRKLIYRGANIFEHPELNETRDRLMKIIEDAEIHPDEISSFSEKFIQASKRIKRYKKEQERIEKHLHVNSLKELRALGRGLTVEEERKRLEAELGLSSDEIKEKIRQIQINEKKLRQMEAEFEESVEDINLMAKEINHGRGMMKYA
jgi:RNA polymerase primary sigma factor